MVSIEQYGEFDTSWCPGCGNFPLLKGMKEALVDLGLQPHEILVSSGIGQAAKTPHYMKCNMFNGLHGRSLPVAQGMKMANPEMPVICESGDGCSYGEGGNHFLAAIRRNMDITLLVHNNQIYGLTKGQGSPTTTRGQVTKTQPDGVPSEAFNPVAVAISMKASFVARAFTGETDHLASMIKAGMEHKGFALIDIMQPCVSFNKVNTFGWYKEHSYILEDHDPSDWIAAMKLADEFPDKIPLGVLYTNDKEPYPTSEVLAKKRYDKEELKKVLQSYA